MVSVEAGMWVLAAGMGLPPVRDKDGFTAPMANGFWETLGAVVVRLVVVTDGTLVVCCGCSGQPLMGHFFQGNGRMIFLVVSTVVTILSLSKCLACIGLMRRGGPTELRC